MSVIDVQADVQRLVLAGSGSGARQATHVLLEVMDGSSARQVLDRELADVDDGHRHDWSDVRSVADRPCSRDLPVSVTIAFTERGLAQLGVAAAELATFPLEFRQGPHVRSAPLGDIGPNRPENWLDPFRADRKLDVVIIVWEEHGGTYGESLVARFGAGTSGLRCLETYAGALLEGDREPFGFVDGKSQPWIREGRPPGDDTPPDGVEPEPLGEFVLGHPTQFGDDVRRWRVPGRGPEAQRIGFNGSFAALRVMAQDVPAFEEWKKRKGSEAAEQACGIRRDGKPLPDGPPINSHVGRANPRQPLVSRSHHRRRLLRRGIPAHWVGPDGPENGLFGLFVCASLAAQYEGVLAEWIHHGIHDPSLSGTNDPLVGYQGPLGESFVTTRGVAYLFLPGRSALQRILGG
jgi:hypothetical protein